jgi:hypothetical protein
MIERPKDPNPLFPMVDEPVTAHRQTDLERQREHDGTPIITRGNHTALQPPTVKLTLNDPTIKKGKDDGLAVPEKPEHDPDEVVKAFLES